MGKLFRGWRRKLGVATLVLACAFMGGWMRSFSTADGLQTKTFFIMSLKGSIVCEITGYPFSSTVKFFSADQKRVNHYYYHPDFAHLWRWRIAGFGFGREDRDIKQADGTSKHIWTIQYNTPYWSIVVPLTLLSTWLLLSKPRISTSKTISESTANDGA